MKPPLPFLLLAALLSFLLPGLHAQDPAPDTPPSFRVSVGTFDERGRPLPELPPDLQNREWSFLEDQANALDPDARAHISQTLETFRQQTGATLHLFLINESDFDRFKLVADTFLSAKLAYDPGVVAVFCDNPDKFYILASTALEVLSADKALLSRNIGQALASSRRSPNLPARALRFTDNAAALLSEQIIRARQALPVIPAFPETIIAKNKLKLSEPETVAKEKSDLPNVLEVSVPSPGSVAPSPGGIPPFLWLLVPVLGLAALARWAFVHQQKTLAAALAEKEALAQAVAAVPEVAPGGPRKRSAPEIVPESAPEIVSTDAGEGTLAERLAAHTAQLETAPLEDRPRLLALITRLTIELARSENVPVPGPADPPRRSGALKAPGRGTASS